MPRHVAVADVVLAAGGARSRRSPSGCEDHVGRVDVGAVVALGEAEGEHGALVEQPRRSRAGGVVVALPDRPEPEDRDLPRVPVGQPVEAEDLVEDRVARACPSACRDRRAASRAGVSSVANARSRARNSTKSAYQSSVRISAVRRRLALGLEPVDRGAEQSLRRGVELGGVEGARIEEARGGGGGRHAVSLSCPGRAVPSAGMSTPASAALPRCESPRRTLEQSRARGRGVCHVLRPWHFRRPRASASTGRTGQDSMSPARCARSSRARSCLPACRRSRRSSAAAS